MGYSYSRTDAGRMALDCDYCGKPGGVRKRTCPYQVKADNSRTDGQRYALPYCQPPAACGPCWHVEKATAHADCEAGAARMQAEYDATQARLDAGDLIVISAHDTRDGMVRVTFGGPGGREGTAGWVDYLVPADAYRNGGFLSDYPDAVPVDQVPATCDHQTGQPGCTLPTCWGVPEAPVLDRDKRQVTETPWRGETGVEALGREVTLAIRERRHDIHVTMPSYADSGWYERKGVRRAQAWEFTAGGVPVRLVSYESRSALLPAMLSYGALYVDGAMVDGAGAIAMSETGVAHVVARVVVRHVEQALRLPPVGPIGRALRPVKLVVTAGEHVDRSLPTASWWDRHRLTPGEYPITFTDVNHRPTPEADRPYYAVAKVPTVLVESYREDRLLWAVRGRKSEPLTPGCVSVVMYGYECLVGATRLGGLATVAAGEPAAVADVADDAPADAWGELLAAL